MTNKPVLSAERILSGIDKTENVAPDGWWETSTGAEFGAKKLAELRALLDKPADQQLKEAYQAGFYEGQNNPNGYVCTKEMANALLAIAQGQEDE